MSPFNNSKAMPLTYKRRYTLECDSAIQHGLIACRRIWTVIGAYRNPYLLYPLRLAYARA